MVWTATVYNHTMIVSSERALTTSILLRSKWTDSLNGVLSSMLPTRFSTIISLFVFYWKYALSFLNETVSFEILFVRVNGIKFDL